MRRRVMFVLLGTVALTVGVAAAGEASEGSIPRQVELYANDRNGLIADLADVAGPGVHGTGIDFDKTTKVGQLNRVFEFTPDFAASKTVTVAVQRRNEWAAPILIDKKPVGLAVVWINPGSLEAELADFTKGRQIGDALSDLAKDVYLVYDEPNEAWFTLKGSTLTALVAGDSGVSGATTLTRYQPHVVETAAHDEQASASGEISSSVIAAGFIVIALLVTAYLLSFPGPPVGPAKPE